MASVESETRTEDKDEDKNEGLHVIYQQEFISLDSGSLILKIQMRCFFFISGSKILKSAKA